MFLTERFITARFTLFASLLFSLGACQSLTGSVPEPMPAASLAITNVTVIDAVSPVRYNQTVYVRDDAIVGIGPSTNGDLRADDVIDGTGRFLIPGLWDMHVHITYEPGLTRAMPDLFLSYGITSVRDTGGLLPAMLPEIARWRAPGVRAPRIFFSGPLLDGSSVVYNGESVPEIGIANASTDSARQNIATLKAAGVDFVKTYEMVKPDVFEALVAAAREAELPIASHVPLMLPARYAGPMVDSMEHLRNIELDCAANTGALLQERSEKIQNPGDTPGIRLRGGIHAEQRPRAIAAYDQEQCNAVIASLENTIQVPTLRLNTSALYQPYDRPDWAEHVQRLPKASRQQWLDTGKAWSERRATLPRESGEFSLKIVGQLNEAGVPIGAGTDTPIGSALPGYSLHTELERLVEAGLSPREALAAATLQPARFVRKRSTMGEVKPGFVADLVLLNANPLDNITNTRAVHQVISKGQLVWSEAATTP